MSKIGVRAVLFGACVVCIPGWAQVYPAKPVRLVVGFSAGSTTDLIGRVVAAKMSEGLGQTMVVDNRPGAGANIAADHVAKSAPDGYTVLLANAGIATGATAYVKLNFNALRDFAPVSQVSATPHVLVKHPSLPAKYTATCPVITSFTAKVPHLYVTCTILSPVM